jgi:hypothetical protein
MNRDDAYDFLVSWFDKLWGVLVFVSGCWLIFQTALNVHFFPQYWFMNVFLIVALFHIFKVRYEKVGIKEMV